MDVIQVPLVPLVDSSNRKLGTFNDSIAFLEQLKKPESLNPSVDEEEEEEPCHIIGETPLHIAIMFDDLETIEYLVECRGINVNQRSMGSIFPGTFKTKETAKAVEDSDYDLLAYYGEYPLCFAGCFANKEIYDYLIDKGADPNLQDSNGNTFLHVMVMKDKIEMFLYACNHPKIKAKLNNKNAQGLTPFNLAAKLGRLEMFNKIININVKPLWDYNNVACLAYSLDGIDTINIDGKINLNAGLPSIIAGSNMEHYDMLNITMIEQLLNDKWETFIKKRFYQRMIFSIIHLIFLSIAVYAREPDSPNVAIFPTTNATTITRYVSEAATVFMCCVSIGLQIKDMVYHGVKDYFYALISEPGLVMYQLFHFFILLAIPFRFVTLTDPYITARHVEETFFCLAIPLGWLHLLFYLKVFRITGPFVVMIYKMIIGDIVDFSTVYTGFTLGFTLAFYFFYKNAADITTNSGQSMNTFFEALHVTFQMTLGGFRYTEFNYIANEPFLKLIFLIFLLFIPLILMNLLIALMGNTYNVISAISDKEWKKQWAHCLVLLERTFSPSELVKYANEYGYKMDVIDGEEEEMALFVRKQVETTKSELKKTSFAGWGRMYNKVQKGRRENKCTSVQLLELWKERNKIVQVVKAKKEKKPFDWALYGGNPHKPAPEKIEPSKAAPEVQKEKTKLEREETKSAEKKILQKEKTVLEKEKTTLEKEKTTLEREKTAVHREKTAIEREKTVIEREKTAIEREKTAIERQKTAIERQKTAIERQKTTLDLSDAKKVPLNREKTDIAPPRNFTPDPDDENKPEEI